MQQSAGYDEYRARRVVVEHRLARLVQLGIRQSRYFGRAKTKFQLYLAATVANLTQVAGKLGRSGRAGGGRAGRSVVLNILPFVVAHAAANFCPVRLGLLWPVILLTPALVTKRLYPTRTFRPGFLGQRNFENHVWYHHPVEILPHQNRRCWESRAWGSSPPWFMKLRICWFCRSSTRCTILSLESMWRRWPPAPLP